MNVKNTLCLTILLAGCDATDVHLRFSREHGDVPAHIVSYERIERAERGNRIPKITLKDCPPDTPRVAVLLANNEVPGFYEIDDAYVDKLTAAGLCPVFISWEKIYEQMDFWKPSGILLPGGSFDNLAMNLDYDMQQSPSYRDLKRAYAYRTMIDYSYHKKLPLLGICAGHQELGISNGAKFKNNIENHKDIDGPGHNVVIKRGSMLHKITGTDTLTVNTAHIEAITPADNINIVAKSPDGVIEAIEPKKPWATFILGVQWHPERMKNGNVIFNAFADAVRKRDADICPPRGQRILVQATNTDAAITLCDDGIVVENMNGHVGRNGAADDKREGDGKTPTGIYEIHRVFGFSPHRSKMPTIGITKDDVWVDDPKSEFYNTLQKSGGDWTSSEDMKIAPYEYGLVVEYNTQNPVPNAGSAIFMHIGDAPTSGCVSTSRNNIRYILEWLNPDKYPSIQITR